MYHASADVTDRDFSPLHHDLGISNSKTINVRF
jgi:hypothetical protein